MFVQKSGSFLSIVFRKREDILAPDLAQLNLLLRFIMSSIHRKINLCGMSVIKHIRTKFLLVGKIGCKPFDKLGGLSGFLKRTESEYDAFGAGHASTAISAALGIATARDFANKDFKVVAIVGDGSMTGGMAYEAMNNAGILKKDLIVVLNDNQMGSLSSIEPKVWSFHNYFTEMLTHPAYNKFKANVWDLTGKLDSFGDRLRTAAQQMEKGIKAVVTPGMLFEALSFRYFGPINGHNVVKLVEIFRHVKDLKGPILIHAITEKGKGYAPAEREVTRLHGVTPFDRNTGISPKKDGQKPAYTDIFGKALVEICKQNPKVVGITAAMSDGTGLIHLHEEMPETVL